MNRIKSNKYLYGITSVVIVIIPILILVLPIIGLLSGTIIEGSRGDIVNNILPSNRSLNLFFRSVILSITISLTSLLIALLAAIGLYKKVYRYERFSNLIGYITILMMLLPSFIHSQGWWNFFEVIRLPNTGVFAAWWVSSIYYFPLPFILIYISMKVLDQEVLEAGAVFLNPSKVLHGVILPSLYPALFGSGLLVFLLSLADYSITSIYSVNTYALDIYAQYSVSGSITDTLLYSVPLILVTLVVGIPGFKIMQRLSFTSKGKTGRRYVTINFPAYISILSDLGLVILFGSIMMLTITLLSGLFDALETVKHISMSGSEFKNTILIATTTFIMSMPLSLNLSHHLNNKKLSNMIYIVLAMPLIMPSGLTGIGLIGIFKGTALYNTAFMPILASVIRYAPIGTILCYGGIKAINQELMDARMVYQKSTINGFIKLYLPIVLPVTLMGGLITAILSTGEIGATIMVLPPGFNTLAIKIYNYLHYGASEVVTALCSLLIIFVAIATSILIYVISLLKKGCD